MNAVSWQTVTSPPLPEPNGIHIWRCHLTEATRDLRLLESILGPEELDRAARYHFPVHRNRFVAGRAHLRKILGGYLHLPPFAISFAYSQFGRPVLAPTLRSVGLTFSVSHSEDLWVLAVGLRPLLGIDVERIRPDFGGEDIARQNFAPNEFRTLLSIDQSQRAQAFFNCWTRKEAYVKALGAGLQIPLDSFEVTLHPNEAPKFLRGADDDWNLLSFLVEDGYQAAVAYRGAIANPRFLQLG